MSNCEQVIQIFESICNGDSYIYSQINWEDTTILSALWLTLIVRKNLSNCLRKN